MGNDVTAYFRLVTVTSQIVNVLFVLPLLISHLKCMQNSGIGSDPFNVNLDFGRPSGLAAVDEDYVWCGVSIGATIDSLTPPPLKKSSPRVMSASVSSVSPLTT